MVDLLRCLIRLRFLRCSDQSVAGLDDEVVEAVPGSEELPRASVYVVTLVVQPLDHGRRGGARVDAGQQLDNYFAGETGRHEFLDQDDPIDGFDPVLALTPRRPGR